MRRRGRTANGHSVSAPPPPRHGSASPASVCVGRPAPPLRSLQPVSLPPVQRGALPRRPPTLFLPLPAMPLHLYGACRFALVGAAAGSGRAFSGGRLHPRSPVWGVWEALRFLGRGRGPKHPLHVRDVGRGCPHPHPLLGDARAPPPQTASPGPDTKGRRIRFLPAALSTGGRYVCTALRERPDHTIACQPPRGGGSGAEN